MGRGDCIKVVVSPEISIYNDSIDHRFPLKQYLDMAHLRGEGMQAGRVGEEETRMRYKIEAKEWGTQAQKKKIARGSSEWDRDEEETRTRY